MKVDNCCMTDSVALLELALLVLLSAVAAAAAAAVDNGVSNGTGERVPSASAKFCMVHSILPARTSLSL